MAVAPESTMLMRKEVSARKYLPNISRLSNYVMFSAWGGGREEEGVSDGERGGGAVVAGPVGHDEDLIQE